MSSFSEIPLTCPVPSIEQQRFYFNKFNQLVPPEINAEYKHSQSDFTRHRKLPFRQFFAVILATVASGKNMGIDTKVGLFFKNARRAGLWPHQRHPSKFAHQSPAQSLLAVFCGGFSGAR
jgi:hypothetical protein